MSPTEDSSTSSGARDKEIVCVDCETIFVFTAQEQDYYLEKGLENEPKRCKPCRVQRKDRARSARSKRGHRSGHGEPGAGDSPAPLFKADFGPPPGASRSQGKSGRSQRGGRPRPDPHAVPMSEDGVPVFKSSYGGARPWERGGEGARRSMPRGGGQPAPASGRERTAKRFSATCSDCGDACRVPFRPDGVQPVYCRNCLPKHRSRRGRPRSGRRDGGSS